MDQIKEVFLYNKRLILGAFIHAGLMWVSLAFAYNSYKEYVRGPGNINIFPGELKIAIKSIFPWGILIFLALYVLYGIGRDKKDDYPTLRLYVVIIVLYTLFVNLIFFSKGASVLIVLNLSSIYFALLLLIWCVIKISVWTEAIIPPVIHKALQRSMPSATFPINNVMEYLKEKPSAPFIIGFMSLLIICAFLSVLQYGGIAKDLANIAYFLLVIGVGIEAYQLIKGKKMDKKE